MQGRNILPTMICCQPRYQGGEGVYVGVGGPRRWGGGGAAAGWRLNKITAAGGLFHAAPPSSRSAASHNSWRPAFHSHGEKNIYFQNVLFTEELEMERERSKSSNKAEMFPNI